MSSSPGLARASGTMAVGTALSRLTGLLRLVALVYAVHFRSLADAYNLANTMPNLVHDVVLGGIVSATFVPVFVARLASDSEEAAWDAISAVTSVAVVVIAVASVVFLVLSPFIIGAMTAFNHAGQAGTERTVAEELLVLFVPQLACYGCISVATALLNARRRFAAPMFVPIVNNVVLVVVLVSFGLLVRNPSVGGVYGHRWQLLLLGLGTTLGVAVQLGALLPSLRRAGLRLRWSPHLGHPAVRTIIGLSGWTFGLVVANQVALLVILALSVHVGPGAVTAYTYAYTFFQLPYGVVAVSIMSATAPELADSWTLGDMSRFRRRMDVALRAMLAAILPAAGAMVVLAKPLLSLLGVMIGHTSSTGTTAVALAMLGLGLPGFCVFLFVVRVLQSTQNLRSAFWLYVLENGVNVVLALALAGPLGVRGIALSIAIAYTVAAVAGLRYVRHHLGGLESWRVGRPVTRMAIATAALVVAAVLGSSVSGSETGRALVARLALGLVAGLAAYVLAMAALTRRDRRRPRHSGMAPPPAGNERPDEDGAPEQRQLLARFSERPTRRGRRAGAPPPPERLPAAGRPPLRPDRLGPTIRPGTGAEDDRGRLDR
jgi:putative peptidoglycan lipid II flippase